MAKSNIFPKKWFPRNPHKYIGDVNNIIVRSSWELRFLNWCDTNSAVVNYASEETIIPYLCETDNKIHRYFIDCKLTIKDKNGDLKTYLCEIKPNHQTMPPVYPGKQTKRYINEVMTFIKNKSKWKAAERYAFERKMEFLILDEYSLGIKKRKKNG